MSKYVKTLRPQHVMLFGDPKTGKSTLAAELILHGYNLVWISLDSGYAIFDKLPQDLVEKHIDLIRLPDTKDDPVGIESSLKIITHAFTEICIEHGRPLDKCVPCKSKKFPTEKVHMNAAGLDTVYVFDHVTQLADSANAYLTKNKSDDYKLDYDDWANQGKIMKKFFTNVQQSKCNIICLAHVLEAENDEGKKRLVPEVGTRNFSVGVAKYFDHVIYCKVDNSKHRFGSMTTFMNNIITGSRTDFDITKQEVPSLAPIFAGLLDAQRADAVENLNGKEQINGLANLVSSAAGVDNRSSNPVVPVVTNNTVPQIKETAGTTQSIDDKITSVFAANKEGTGSGVGIVPPTNNALSTMKERLAAMKNATPGA